MAIVTCQIKHEWDLKYIMLERLKDGPKAEDELFAELTAAQQGKDMFDIPGLRFRDPDYRLWLRENERDHFVDEHDGRWQLTRLGNWIVNSELGNFWLRRSFINRLVCYKCAPSGDLILLHPVSETFVVEGDGYLFTDVECQRCGSRYKRMFVGQFSREGFIEFYNRALAELSGIVTGELL